MKNRSNKLLLTIILFCATYNCVAQNKSDYVMAGKLGFFLDFNSLVGTRPVKKVVFNGLDVGWCASSLCDSASGRLLYKSNGMKLFDSNMVVIQNGAELVDSLYYALTGGVGSNINQGSMILPVGDKVYCINQSITNEMYVKQDSNFTYDRIYYHIIDPKGNSNKGSVISKKNILRTDTFGPAGMHAIRHANGVDWWLYKTGAKKFNYPSFRLHRWLLTINGFSNHTYITLPSYPMPFPDYNGDEVNDGAGIHFNEQGTQFILGTASKIIKGDVNRCSGDITNMKVHTPPRVWTFNEPDSSTFFTIVLDTDSLMDRWLTGVCFSPNGKYIYITRNNSIMQWDWADTNASTAYVVLRAGGDTVWQWRNLYNQCKVGPDNRVYISSLSGDAWQVIDNPDVKGLACSLRLREIIVPRNQYPSSGMGGMSNSPNYKLGVDYSSCWPLANEQLPIINTQFTIYPNPTNTAVTIDVGKATKQQLSISNTTGQQVYTQVIGNAQTSIDVSRWVRGVYFVKYNGVVRKMVVE
jgi:hypothetical protein